MKRLQIMAVWASGQQEDFMLFRYLCCSFEAAVIFSA